MRRLPSTVIALGLALGLGTGGQACLFSGIRVIFGGPPETIGCFSTENKG
jgi:hypothetical protein